MELTTHDMRKLFEILMTYAEKCDVKKVSLNDYYVKVYPDDLEKFLANPKEHFTLGSVKDDIEDLKKVLSDEYTPTTVDIEKFGAVMTALGQEIIK